MTKYLILTIWIKNSVVDSQKFDNILMLMQEFDVKHPFIIHSRNPFKKKLSRTLFKHGQYSAVLGHIDTSIAENEKIIAMIDDEYYKLEDLNIITDILENFKSICIVMGKGIVFDKIFSETHLKINQQIYFYNEDSQEIFETYNINSHKIEMNLGNITQNGFKWTENVNPNFIRRRSNFHGLVLKVMVEFSGIDMNADKSYLTSAPYFSGKYVICF